MKMAMEFSARHSHRVQTVSADDMNKVNIGVPAVSRYHQLRRFFAVADGPNMPDHDFPVTKRNKLIPSGYMLLENHQSGHRSASAERSPHSAGTGRQRRSRSVSPERPSRESKFVRDKLGRLHLQCERSGPVFIFCRSATFQVRLK